MPAIRVSLPSPRPWLIGVSVVAVVLLVALAFRTTRTPIFASQCETWDIEATAALASLITDRNELSEARVSDGVFRLKRARKFCRQGLIALAQHDYDALLGSRYVVGR
jgi:hypothetical protein